MKTVRITSSIASMRTKRSITAPTSSCNATKNANTNASLDALPVDICFAQICAFVHLQDRWRNLARVSHKWRQLAITSVHNDRHVDLVSCARYASFAGTWLV